MLLNNWSMIHVRPLLLEDDLLEGYVSPNRSRFLSKEDVPAERHDQILLGNGINSSVVRRQIWNRSRYRISSLSVR